MFDVAVVGGGVNGTGIARDAALRGLKVVLFEKNDLGSGTTGASSGMIHGGLRYLLQDPQVTRLACLDSGYIQRIVPHLLFRIPFLMLVRGKPSFYLDLVDTYVSVYDRFAPLKRGLRHLRLSRSEALRLEPGLSPEIQGGVLFDEWGIDTFRLCALNARSARDAGAVVRTHTEVVGFLFEGSSIVGLRVRPRGGSAQASEEVRARVVVNAAGPWLPKLCGLAGASGRIRPGKGIHVVFDRRLSNLALLFDAVDGRSIFLMPHEQESWLGTTDDDFYGDLDRPTAGRDEIEYLFQGAERVFPSIREARAVRVFSGVRPTLARWGGYEDDLSRDHEVWDHEERDGVGGFLTIAGGKLASYRAMSEEVVDRIVGRFGLAARSITHERPLPGGEAPAPPVAQLARTYALAEHTALRLAYRHGGETPRVLEGVREDPARGRVLCACEPVTAAEVSWACRNEWAVTLDDVRRRTRLGQGPCQGTLCTLPGAVALGRERNFPPPRVFVEAADFLEERFRERRPALRGMQTVQEVLHQTLHRSVANLDELGERMRRTGGT